MEKTMNKIDLRSSFNNFMQRFKNKGPRPPGMTYSDLAAKVKGSKKKILFILLIAVVGMIVLARTTANIQKVLFQKKEAAPQKALGLKFEEETMPVKVFKVKRTEFRDTLPVIGTVKGFKEIDLKFQVAGIIESFNFEEGEKIQDGDIITSLIQRDQLLKLKYAEIELNKNKKLFEIGAISPLKLEQAKLEYESARSELDKTNIYAMSNGLLGARLMDVGSYVTPNDKVGIFVDIDKVYAEFNVIEKDVPKVALGQKVEVFSDAYMNKSFNGVIDRIAPIIEGRSRTETVKVELDNKEGLLKPGMFVRALISTYEKKDDIVIPASAIKRKENETFVYVVTREEPKEKPAEAMGQRKAAKKAWWDFGKTKNKEEARPAPESKERAPEYGTIEVRKIELGYTTQDLLEVREGLKEDELIVVEVQEEFKDKSRVEISEVQEGLI
jgi:RND family efflux transporter MFP subunit